MIDLHEYIKLTRAINLAAAGIVVVMAGALAMFAGAAKSDAHPFDAPQLSDISSLGFTPASCEAGYTSVSARNVSTRAEVFELQRKSPDGEWRLASDDNDGVVSYIAGKRYEGRSNVLVAPGELFEIDHYQPTGDSGEYRLVSGWEHSPVEGPIAGWESTRVDCMIA